MTKLRGIFHRNKPEQQQQQEQDDAHVVIHERQNTLQQKPPDIEVPNYFKFPKSKYGQPQKQLGFGVSAKVTEYVKDDPFATTFAVKTFRYEEKEKFENFKTFKERIGKEAQLHVLINSDKHPSSKNMVKFVDFFSVLKKNLYYVMEFAGEPLNEYYCSKFVDLSKFQKLDLFKQVVCGVDYLQSINISHRDIKPENCCVKMASDDSDLIQLKIIDFGSSIMGNKGYGIVGSKHYAAPEVFTSLSYDSFKSDIWSLGVVFVYVYYFKFVNWNVANEREDENFKDYKRKESYESVVKEVETQMGAPGDGEDELAGERWLICLVLDMLKVKPTERVVTTGELLERIAKNSAATSTV
ncbi:unnamed protein product [Ambrosiozyma monospora]|uniref:Unnamed protein product n=1 Tax=Ambrosiozyma monospora TaxID=43982 RepID=A0A9W7DHC3_AMBMO|nr:unnamed protein product [Ambrosiozyma monospora]